MPDREMVIADLEEQISWIRDNDFHKFPGWGHAVLAMRDALELLKAQEPRVLTLGEVEALTADPFLVETRGGKLTWGTYYSEYTYYGALMARMVDFDGEVDDRIKGDYGLSWRCWSARPSDERRRAEAWEKS